MPALFFGVRSSSGLQRAFLGKQSLPLSASLPWDGQARRWLSAYGVGSPSPEQPCTVPALSQLPQGEQKQGAVLDVVSPVHQFYQAFFIPLRSL